MFWKKAAAAVVATLALVAGNALITTQVASAALTCTITGTEGADILNGTSGADVICGLGGDDSLFGVGGNDTLLGGDGGDQLFGGDGTDVLEGEAGSDSLSGGLGDDTFGGGDGTGDTVTYGDAASRVSVDLGRLDGTDSSGRTFSSGNGQAGESDKIAADIERVQGSEFDDTLTASDRADNLSGKGGNDTIAARGLGDALFGEAGNDLLIGDAGADFVVPGAGTDVARGSGGADIIAGDAVADGADDLDGGAGTDMLTYNGRAAAVRVNLASTAADQGSYTPSTGATTEGDKAVGFEQVTGGNGDDLLIGAAADELLIGGAGNDEVRPGAGTDDVRLGDGDDLARSRDGVRDVIDCGNGIDRHQSETADTLTNCETLVPPDTDLAVTISGAPNPVAANHAITYTVGLQNLGSEDESSATVEVRLPVELTAPSVPSACTAQGGNVYRCSAPMAHGASTSFVLSGTPLSPGTLSANAFIFARVSTGDSDTTNDSASTTTTVQYANADLGVTITDSPDPVGVGSPIAYQVTITNAGTEVEQSAVLDVRLPSALSAITAPPACGAQGGGRYLCTTGVLSPGGNTAFALSGTSTSAGEITASVSILSRTSTSESTPSGNESASTTTTVKDSTDFAVAISTSQPTFNSGQMVTINASVTNLGSVSGQARFYFTGPFPNFGFTTTGASCASGSTNGIIDCSASVAPGQSLPVTLSTPAMNYGIHLAQITAYDGATNIDPDRSNNSRATFYTVRETTTTGMSCNPTSVPVGYPATCSVLVSKQWFGSTRGEVKFTAKGTGASLSASSCTLDSLGRCSVSLSGSSVRGLTLTAAFQGTSDGLLPSTSPAVGVSVKLRKTALALSCTTGFEVNTPGGACTATATDVDLIGGSAVASTPQGTVTIAWSNGPTGVTCTLDSAGRCGVNYTNVQVPSIVYVRYLGSAVHGAAPEVSQNLDAQLRPTSTALDCGAGPFTIQATYSCTATVTDIHPNPVIPAGTVKLGSQQCSLTHSGAPPARCTLLWTPTATSTTLSASYVKSVKHAASTSPPVTLTANKRLTATSIQCPSGEFSIAAGPQSCTVTVTDTGPTGAYSAPTGSVKITASAANGTISPTTCNLSASSATEASCLVSFDATKGTSVVLTAAYNGSAKYATSSGNTGTLAIKP